jgi:hypothetical protein
VYGVCVRRHTSDSPPRPPSLRRTPRRAVILRLVSHSLYFPCCSARPQRGTVCCCAVSLVLLSCPRLAPHTNPRIHNTRGSSGTQRAAHRDTPLLADKDERQCASDPGLSSTTAHLLCPSGSTDRLSCWLARQTRKNHTRSHDLLRSATRHSHSCLHARRHRS